MQKKSELSEISDKANLCDDPREAWLEINSGRYDSYFKRLMKIYFSSEYNNTNELKVETSEIRKRFLEDFDFRKAIIEFGEKKGLGKENPQVWKTFTQRMNFEETNLEEIQIKYKEQIKALFFGEEENENTVKEDPILNILPEEEKTKVILSKKYGGDIQTFSKLITILESTTAEEQENILKYLVSERFKNNLVLIDIGGDDGNIDNFSLENILRLIDIVDKNSYNIIFKMLPMRDTYGYNRDNYLILISHILEKHKGKNISTELLELALSKVKHTHTEDVYQKLLSLMKEYIENFINSLTIENEDIDKQIFKLLTNCFEYINANNLDIRTNNEKVNLDILKDIYEKENYTRRNYNAIRGIEKCQSFSAETKF